ncbi:MAG: recombinase family protein [Phycisphaerales bacterium]|nr:recombinase family protein [Phycisphaerales bacterium]
MRKSNLNGKRAIPLLRCSTFEQKFTSKEDQRLSIAKFVDDYGMELGEPLLMAGISGSIKKNLEDMVDEVIKRKQSGERIDVLVYFDQSRFGRAGPLHFGKMSEKLADAGIELAEADGYMEDEGSRTFLRLIKAQFACEQAKSIALASARGSQSSLQQGRRGHATRAPYGTDKLYSNSAGERKCVLRRATDGTRYQLDPETGEVIETYQSGLRGYRKSSLEHDTLIIGDPKHHEIVCRIYRLKLENGHGSYLIARMLNDEGVSSPTGRCWYPQSIKELLNNEVYTGFAYANQYAGAIYFNHAPDMPIPNGHSGGKIVRGIRPEEYWHRVEYPELVNFLPAELFSAAIEMHAARRGRIKNGRIQNPDRKNGRRKQLLSGILIEKSSGKEMIAAQGGWKKRIFYKVSGLALTSKETPLRRRIPSAPVEKAVLDEIESLLCDLSNLKPLIVSEIQRQEDASRSEHGELERLEIDQQKLKKKYALQLSQLGGSMDDLVQDSLDQTKRQLQVIDDRLSQIAVGHRMNESEINGLADAVIEDLRPLLDELSGTGDVGLRKIVESFVGSAVVDLVEGKVDFEFVLPNELLMQRYRGLASSRRPASGGQAPNLKPITLSTRAVLIPDQCRGKCWESFIAQGCRNCHRKPRAA